MVFTVLNSETFAILLLPLSDWEVQIFLIDHAQNIVFLDESPWVEQQVNLITTIIQNQSIKLLHPAFPVDAFVGTWHFGHLLGDHGLSFLMRHSNPFHAPNPLIDPLPNTISLDILTNTTATKYPTLPCLTTRNTGAIMIHLSYASKVYFPHSSKADCLSMLWLAKDRAIRRLSLNNPSRVNHKVFLTSQRTARIINGTEIENRLAADGWLIINPLKDHVDHVLLCILNASILLCENGSILFNCFLSRSQPYLVLASTRIFDKSDKKYDDGGYIYNHFHDGLISYIPCRATAVRDHPYSDQIYVNYSDIKSL